VALNLDNLSSASELQAALQTVGYLAGAETATACFLAVRLRRPLLCEGEAGVGKTSLAASLAEALDIPLFRLQCYEGLTASQALYEWDFAKQLLHVRVMSTASGPQSAQLAADLYSRRFLLPRAVLRAFEASPSVLLIDEVDRADDEFEAFLLEALSDFSITIPELGRITPTIPPLVILTSNRTREVHDALKRRCLYHWIEHPSQSRELEILVRRFPSVSPEMAADVADAAHLLRSANLLKPPGVAESLDWVAALQALNAVRLDRRSAAQTLDAVLKYREDQQRVRADNFAVISAALRD
jgi:MoxR-like ATPase